MTASCIQQVEGYLRHRRRLGFKLDREGYLLRLYARYHDRVAPTAPLSIPIILDWVKQPSGVRPSYLARRLRAVRGFAIYCAALDRRTQVPDYRLAGPMMDRRAPHIYSKTEVRLILQRAAQLPTFRSQLRPRTYGCLVGLIACTGMRVNEAMRLNLADFDDAAGTLQVPASKLSPQRRVPLHLSTVEQLRQYRDHRLQFYPFGERFFLGRAGRPLKRTDVHRTFRVLCEGIRGNGARALPRIHDFRHTFATKHVGRWCREAAPLTHRLLLLSRYLGHQNFNDTWWYVSAQPASLRAAADRFERFHRNLTPINVTSRLS